MATYSWVGGSAPWATPGDWTIGGVPTASIPGGSDDAVIEQPGSYSISLGTVSVESVSIVNPAATLRVATSLAATTITNAGTIISNGYTIAAVQLFNSGSIDGNANNLLVAGVAVAGGGGILVNTGQITLNGLFKDYASSTTAQLGNIVFAPNGPTGFYLSGTLDNTEATLAATASSLTIWDGARIIGGTVDAGEDFTVGGHTTPTTLENVTVVGSVSVNGSLVVVGGLQIQPTSGVTGALLNTYGITDLPTQTLSSVIITGGQVNTAGTLTLAATTALTGVHLEGAGTVVNAGTIVASTITVGSFANSGIVATYGVATLINPANALLSNTGVLLANGSTLTVQSEVTGNGTIAVSGGGTAALLDLYSQQVFGFETGNGTLKLSAPGGTNVVLGFGQGSVIDLVRITATVAYAGGTLTASSGGAPIAGFVVGLPASTQFIAKSDGAGGTLILEAPPCFAAGTRIALIGGERPVEALGIGDRVRLAGGGSAAITWIGHRRIDSRRHPRPQDVRPVLVCAGAFGERQPIRDLVLSPDHAVAVDGVLIPIRYLINGRSIRQSRITDVTYFHVELARHGVLLAEGLACESYLDTGNRAAFANGGGATMLHPDFARDASEQTACAELVLRGPRVVAARQSLLDRAAALGHRITADAGLRVLADGRRLNVTLAGSRVAVRLPPRADRIRLVSRNWRPAHTRSDESDMRRLGIAVSEISLDGRPLSLADPRLSSGWHCPEPDGAGGSWAWTTGDAGIAIAGERDLHFTVAMTGSYWLPIAAGYSPGRWCSRYR